MAGDVFQTAKGGKPTTITVPFLPDTTTLPYFLENALTVTIGASPAGYSLPADYSPPQIGHGDSSTDKTKTFTLALISPISGKTVVIPGCMIEELTLTMDMGTEAGRMHATATFKSFYYHASVTTAPTGMSAYGSTHYFLYDLTAIKQIKALDVVLSKAEFKITNPVVAVGFQGSNGDPEAFGRAIPKATVTGSFLVKYDVATADLWASRAVGSTGFSVELSDNAIWASATFGFKADNGVVTNDLQPQGGDAGVFIPLEIEFLGTSGGNVITIVP